MYSGHLSVGICGVSNYYTISKVRLLLEISVSLFPLIE